MHSPDPLRSSHRGATTVRLAALQTLARAAAASQLADRAAVSQAVVSGRGSGLELELFLDLYWEATQSSLGKSQTIAQLLQEVREALIGDFQDLSGHQVGCLNFVVEGIRSATKPARIIP